MARHFAKVVTSPVGIGTTTVVNKVTNVIVAEPDFFDSFVDDTPGRWVETFKGMFGGSNWLYWMLQMGYPTSVITFFAIEL